MLFPWLIYAVVLFSSVLFFIMYKDMLALVLLLLIIAFPVIMFITGLITRLLTKVKVTFDKTVVNKGDSAHLIITVNNYSPFNTSNIKITGTCHNAFFNGLDKLSVSVWSGPFSSKSFDFEIESKHVGNVEIALKKAYFHDLINLFCFAKSLKSCLTLSVIPECIPLENEFRPNYYMISESNEFSKSKPGDDPSEVFNIRDFAGGDKLNRIHWKLSTKQEHFMVKDYSLPISENILILPEFICKNTDDIECVDTVLETAYSISMMLIEQRVSHSFAWYNCKLNAIQTAKISSIEELYTAIGGIYNSVSYYTKPYLADLDTEYRSNASNILYISPDVTSEVCSAIENIGGASNYTVISVENKKAASSAEGEVNLIHINPGKVSDCLAGVAL